MTTFLIDEFKNIETPFYYYDMELPRLTLDEVKKQAGGSKVHYAVKANANPRILAAVREAGLGVDCVSGGGSECWILRRRHNVCRGGQDRPRDCAGT